MREYRERSLSIAKEYMTKTVFTCWAVFSLIAALAGPFGTFESLPFLLRLCYWAGLGAVSIFIAVGFRVFWRLVLNSEPDWREDVAVIVSLSIVFGPMIVKLNEQVFGPHNNQTLGLAMSILITALVSVAILIVKNLAVREVNKLSITKRDRLLDRIGAPSGARLTRISSDNHYIRIWTDDDQEYRILMRLRDAVGEIEHEPGFCVHRSHWVAEAHIARVEEAQGREVVLLSCGGKLPVGPKYRSNLVSSGKISA